jgi:hypothetical protein
MRNSAVSVSSCAHNKFNLYYCDVITDVNKGTHVFFFCKLQALWWLVLNFDSSSNRTASRYRVWTEVKCANAPFPTTTFVEESASNVLSRVYSAVLIFHSFRLALQFSVGRGNHHPNLTYITLSSKISSVLSQTRLGTRTWFSAD